MEIYGDSLEESQRNIRRSDNARAAYYKNISGGELGDANNYELCIDSSIGLAATVDVIMAYLDARK